MPDFPSDPARPRFLAAAGVPAALAAATLAAALAACAQAQPFETAAARSETAGGVGDVPLPAGWRTATPDLQDPRRGRPDAPLWGVPAFAAPTATHCARPPVLSETAGSPAASPHGRARSDGSGRAAGAGPARVDRGAPVDAPASVASAVAPGTPVPPGTAGTPGTPGVPASDARVSEARVSEARASEAPTSAAHGDDVRAKPAPRAGSVPGQSPPPPRPPRSDLKAGLVDDNADFAGYLAFLERHAPSLQRQRDVSERYRVLVTDARGRPVPDAELALSWPGAPAATLWARTDAAGTAWLHPRALLSPDAVDARHALQVLARGPDGSVARAALVRGQRAPVLLQVGSAPVPPRTPLDLVFMVDATGSMGDEIAKLRASMQSIAERIARLPGRVDLCLGLVAYRDLGDEYVTRRYDLTGDLAAFQRVLGGLRASGGGDEPEALDEALHETVHGIGWRGAGTSRLVLMIGDAPPHLRADVPHYDQSATAALARGIKVHAVGASGLNRQGETTFRSIAQLTGGRFVFLTYEDAARPGRGPGTETPHDVRDYRVADLDELIVRLVREEVAARAGS